MVPVISQVLIQPSRIMDTMKRNSEIATRIVEDLRIQGIILRPRRLEGWTHNKLGPLPGTLYLKQLKHFATLAELARPRRSADLIAILMAAHGFACERLCGAIMREVGLTDRVFEMPTIDLSTGPSGDEGFAVLEKIACEIESQPREIPAPLENLVLALQSNVRYYSEKLGEPADHVLQSALMNFLCATMGGSIYNLKATAAAVGVDPDAIDQKSSEDLGQIFRELSILDIAAEYRSISPEVVAKTSQELRPILNEMFWSREKNSLSEHHLDWFSVVFSPVFIYLIRIWDF